MMKPKNYFVRGALKAFTSFTLTILLAVFFIQCHSIVENQDLNEIQKVGSDDYVSTDHSPVSEGLQEKQDQDIPNRSPLDDEKYKVTSSFGMRMHPIFKERRMHRGVDFKAAEGTPIYATANGSVLQIQNAKDGDGYGNMVIIQHSSEIVTRYAHMQGFGDIEVGQDIKQGDLIGYVGNTGKSFEPHLHYEILVKDKPVDPSTYF